MAAGQFTLASAIPGNLQLFYIGLFLLVIGVQPPNQQALWIVGGTALLQCIVWFAIERRRFQGPPIGDMIKRRQAVIAAAEAALDR